MRRDSSDQKWQAVKARVKKRDGNKDRILRVLTVKEALLLQKKAPSVMLKRLDAAHLFPVSMYPDLMYNDANIVMLNRWSHSNLDELRHPITGDPISYDERQAWWERIAGEKQWSGVMSYLDK